MIHPHPERSARRTRRRRALALSLALEAACMAPTLAQTPAPEGRPKAVDEKKAGTKAAPAKSGGKTEAGKGTPAKGSAAPAKAGTPAAASPAGSGAKSAPATGTNPAPGGKPAPGAPAAAPAGQPPAPAPAAPPMPMPAPATRVPAGMIKMDFRSTDIDAMLQAFSLAYKWTVVKDPACTGPVTVIETQPMDQKRAFQVLLSVLEVRGFTALVQDNILKVMPIKRAISSNTTVRLAVEDNLPLDRSQVITEVISLSNAEASTIAKDLVPLMTEGASLIGASGANALIVTDTAANIQKLRTVVTALDKGAGNNELEIFHLKHVQSKQMTEVINNLFKQIAPRSPSAPAGQPGQPPQPPQPGQARPAEPRPAIAAVEDERTNSVIVVGSSENLKRVRDLVEKLDNELNPHRETKVYEVKYAEAQKLAQLVNDALVGGQAGQTGASQPQYGGFNPFERRAQGNQATSFSAGQTRIVADTRTNTLVITADSDTMKVVEELLAKLDQKVEYMTTTFSIKLKNQNADDMAYVLAQAFGTQQQNFNPFGFFGFFGDGGGGDQQSRRDRRIKRRLNSGDNNGRADAGSQPAGGFVPEPPAGTRLADGSKPQLPPGAEQLAQYYYDYYGGPSRRGSDATTGRTSSGRYVNLLQLRGNVLVTPERNTNSLIITTTPENAEAVKELVAELDIETKQVLLEAIVTEITLDKQTRFGIDYLFKDLKNSITGAFPAEPSTGHFGSRMLNPGLTWAVIPNDNFRAVLTAIGQDEKIRILSTPRVFTSNNQEAEIEVTDRLPYQSGTTIGFGGQASNSTRFLDVGLILNVTPRITVDGMVTVDVYQEDSNLVEFRTVGRDQEAPVTTQRVTDTSVTLKDGDTLVLSGLQKTAVRSLLRKIPLLGDIPILGNLFRSTDKRSQRTELVVFLTPRVVSSADEARRLGQQELNRVQKKLPEAHPTIQPEPLTTPVPDK